MLKPIHDNILLVKFKDEKEASAIILTAAIDKGPVKAVVKALGEHCNQGPHVFHEGDKVLIPCLGNTELSLDGELHYITKESNIMAVLP